MPVESVLRDWGRSGEWRRREWEYHELDRIVPGDIIDLAGTLRVVRAVTRTSADHVYTASFAKVRRSGYGSPLTVLHRWDILYRFRGIRGRYRLDATVFDRVLQAWIALDHPKPPCSLTEDDVVGVLR